MQGERSGVAANTFDEARIAPAHKIEVYCPSVLNPRMVKRTLRDWRKGNSIREGRRGGTHQGNDRVSPHHAEAVKRPSG